MSTRAPAPISPRLSDGVRIAIAAARFNAEVVDELVRGCIGRLKELGIGKARIELHRVPGAFELPLTADALAATGRFDAVICLGAVIRGETPHFDFVAGECARGIREVAVKRGLPVIFGVLTTNTDEQAWARSGGKHGHVGRQSADAALEMISTLQAIRGR